MMEGEVVDETNVGFDENFGRKKEGIEVDTADFGFNDGFCDGGRVGTRR